MAATVLIKCGEGGFGEFPELPRTTTLAKLSYTVSSRFTMTIGAPLEIAIIGSSAAG